MKTIKTCNKTKISDVQHEQIREVNIKLQTYPNGEIANLIDPINQDLAGYGKEYIIKRKMDKMRIQTKEQKRDCVFLCNMI